MFVGVHTPDHLSGIELDACLERGWFRMGQTIFTTNFAHVKDKILSTIWLRMRLKDYIGERTHIQLAKRNAGFIVSVQPASLTEEKEALFAAYRGSLPFTVSESLRHLLFGKETVESIYNTYEVTVRDRGKLIACGFFDRGEKSAEGIVSFYDPAYKKFSPGKYLIYSKIQYCKDIGLEYFYPGYFVPGNPNFDYKLSVGKQVQEFLHVGSGTWRSISGFSAADIPADTMRLKLEELALQLQAVLVESHVLKYEFFDAGLIPDMRDSGLLDFPYFLVTGPLNGEPAGIIIVYDVRDEAYHLLVCMPVWKPDRTNPDASFYSAYFLKPVQEIYKAADAQIMSALVTKLLEKMVSESNINPNP